MSKNPYSILGVKEDASQDEIKKAYRKLAKKHHPDLNPGNKQNENKFKEISHAYDQVGTPEARAKFDRGETEQTQYQNTDSQKQQWSSFYNTQKDKGRYSQSFADSFGDEDFFEHLFGRSKQGGRKRAAENEDVHYQMDISFADSVKGAEKIITLANGKNLKIKIPPGVAPGAKLRFKGQGSLADESAPPGDAFVQINIIPQEGWSRDGHDVEMELPLSFIESLMGAEISVPTMHGPVMLKIPPGVSTGSKLRIKGKGVITDEIHGNQIVKIKIVMPKHPSSELQNEIKKWGGKFDYNPRGHQ
jgi:DnaJ-class molecular chaperone